MGEEVHAEIRYLSDTRQPLLPLSWWFVVEHGRERCRRARPVYPAPPTLCFHKSRPGGVPSGMGRCSCTHCHAFVHPCLQLPPLLLFFILFFLVVLSDSTPSLHLLLLSSRHLSPARPYSFKCFFMWFRRFVSMYFFFIPPASSNSAPFPRFLFPIYTSAHAFTFRFPGVITASCGLLAVCRRSLQVVPRARHYSENPKCFCKRKNEIRGKYFANLIVIFRIV